MANCATQFLMLLAACAATGAGGCAGSSGPPASDRPSAAPDFAGPVASAAKTDLDEQLLIGPTAARVIGARIDWQVPTSTQDASGISRLDVQGDSVFILDGRNYLTRLNRESGLQAWRLPVAEATTEILGIAYMPEIEQVFLASGSAIFVLDAATGSQVGRQKLGQIANTALVVRPPYFLYGARNGQLVWHSYEVGYQGRGYQVSESIRITPTLVGGTIVVVGTDGTLMGIDVDAAAQLWSERLLDEVIAPPAAADELIYVAGLDQHLWAFDARTGRRAWRYLSESPLESSPVVIGDRVYQYVPGEGLLCFEARPLDAPGGRQVWRAADVRGVVLGAYPRHLLVWDERERRLTTVERARGGLIESVSLPLVRHVLVTGPESGNIFAAANDGRVIRLVPRS